MKTNGNSPNGNAKMRMCVSCGEKSASTRRIYQSLVHKFDDKDDAALKWIFRCGLSVPMCEKCLRKYQRLILRLQLIIVSTCLGAVGLVVYNWKGFWSLVLLVLAVGLPFLFYYSGRISLFKTFLPRLVSSECKELSRLRSKGYEFDFMEGPRNVQDAQDVTNWQKEHDESFKHESWTEHTVYKWIGDFDPERQRMDHAYVVRSVDAAGNFHLNDSPRDNVSDTLGTDEEIVAKRSEAHSWQKAAVTLENPPNGVEVSELKDTRGYCIVYRRRRMGRIIIGLLWLTATGLGAAHFASSIDVPGGLVSLLSCGAFILGCLFLLRELFGKDTLKLTPPVCGDYTESVSIISGQRKFWLSPKTDIRYKSRHGFWDIEYRDIVVQNVEKTQFGSSLPNEVQDYLCVCMSRWAQGRPLAVAHGATWLLNIECLFLFCPMFLATVACFAYAVSCTEIITVRHGSVRIVESELWGRREKVVTEIPCRDIDCISVHEWHGRKGTAGRYLRIIGHDKKEITTIDGLDAKADEYRDGMERALKGTYGEMFERKRNNGGWSWLVALLLGFFSAICCGDGKNPLK